MFLLIFFVVVDVFVVDYVFVVVFVVVVDVFVVINVFIRVEVFILVDVFVLVHTDGELVFAEDKSNFFGEYYGEQSRCFKHEGQWFLYKCNSVNTPQHSGSGCYKVTRLIVRMEGGQLCQTLCL